MSGIRTHNLSNQAVNTYALDRAAFGAGSESIGGGIIVLHKLWTLPFETAE
jgi:hypothetical protein